MLQLPIGIQDFPKLRKGPFVYVDKTELIRQTLKGGYYFLSRPRRFGKSLLVSTLKQVFLGNRALFEGLWLYDNWTWEPRPVLHFDFASAEFKQVGLERTLLNRLAQMADEYQIELTTEGPAARFQELLRQLAGRVAKVAILIDEHDRPINEYLDNLPLAEQNRDLLRDFFSAVKPNDASIHFFFMTGVSRFSKVSMFSGFNNLLDLSLNPKYNNLLGYTQAELEHYFADHLDWVATEKGLTKDALLANIKVWYNGYNWDGRDTVYNPWPSSTVSLPIFPTKFLSHRPSATTMRSFTWSFCCSATTPRPR
jgi:hypothetical protein